MSGVANRKNSWEIERRGSDLIEFSLSLGVWIWSKGWDRVERDMIYVGKWNRTRETAVRAGGGVAIRSS